VESKVEALARLSTTNYADKRISRDIVQRMTQTEYSELLKPSTANCADKRIGGDVVQLIEYSELRG
jgi:hypothetical protein